MMNSKYINMAVILLLFMTACVPPSDEIKNEVNIDYESVEVREMINWQNDQNLDSLYNRLSSPNPSLRYLSLTALASIQDDSGLAKVIPLLKDPVMEIRSMAAYTLGQMGNPAATDRLISAFVQQDTLDVNNIMNGNILEALGKIGGPQVLNQIASVETYRPDDTILIMSQMRSIYGFGLRGITNAAGTGRALQVVTDKEYNDDARLLAAHYLARNKNLILVSKQPELLDLLKRESNVDIRMAIALSMQHFKDQPEFLAELTNHLDIEKDYRVKVFLLKALYDYPYAVAAPVMKAKAADPNTHIATTAAQYFVDKGNAEDVYTYKSLITSGTPWQVKSIIYKALMQHTPLYFTKVKNAYAYEIDSLYNEAKTPFEKGAYANALSKDPYQYVNLLQKYSQAKEAPAKTAIAEGLKDIVKSPFIIKAFGENYIRIAKNITDTIYNEVVKGDVGAAVQFADMLKSKNFNWNLMMRDSTWKESVFSNLKAPKDLEAIRELKTAMAELAGEKYVPEKTKAIPIDWTMFDQAKDSSSVLMKTSKGNISIRLYKKHAPATVANFLALCGRDFYDGKIFHRVVPNFVVQGGCPIGNGYGALDYTIASEVAPKYYDSEGYVGMASLGKHTEGVQFFITHSPTPHLDGKYTIFGKVIEGMDVVHQLQIGDTIIDAILVK